MKHDKPNHRGSRKSFIAMGICFCIVGMVYKDETLSGISAYAALLFYVFLVCGIVKRKKENKAFEQEKEQYDRTMKIRLEQERVQKQLEFEKEALQLSSKYARSPLTQDIVNWSLNNFSDAFLSADRSNCLEEVQFSLTFDVRMHWINCRSTNYSFLEKRYESLKTPLEKAALARALGSAMSFNIEKKYVHDLSGSNYKLDVKYTDYENRWGEESFSSVTITYRAPNEYFVPAKHW